MSRTRRVAAGVLAALALLVVAGCGSESGTPPDTGTPSTAQPSEGAGAGAGSGSDVDTPRLRQLRGTAGIEPCPSTEAGASSVADGLPATTLACLGGGHDVALPGLRGQPTVINVWASWCGPCRAEMPYLQQLHERTAGDLQVIGIDFQDANPVAALHVAADTGVTYPLLADPEGTIREDLGVVGLPQTVFVNRSGRIVATERREVTSYRQLADLVREHLKVTP